MMDTLGLPAALVEDSTCGRCTTTEGGPPRRAGPAATAAPAPASSSSSNADGALCTPRISNPVPPSLSRASVVDSRENPTPLPRAAAIGGEARASGRSSSVTSTPPASAHTCK